MGKILYFDPNPRPSPSESKILDVNFANRVKFSESSAVDYSKLLSKYNWILKEKVYIDSCRMLFRVITDTYIEQVYARSTRLHITDTALHFLETFDTTHSLVESDLLRTGWLEEISIDHPYFEYLQYFINLLEFLIQDIHKSSLVNSNIYLKGVMYLLEEVLVDFRCLEGSYTEF